MTEDHKRLRTRMMQWHRNKRRTPAIIDLLDSTYQTFRSKVGIRLGVERIDFYEAIKKANYQELQKLENIILEEKIK